MGKTVGFFLFLIFYAFHVKADTLPTVLYGSNKEYAGQIIQVYKYADYITNIKELLDSDTISATGDFELKYHQNETLQIILPIGIYETVLFTEPGSNYEVVLPPNQPIEKRDILNPFFQPVQMYLGVKNIKPNDLNLVIAEFNELYHNYIDSNYYDIYRNPRASKVDSAIFTIESKYEENQNEFFKNYRKYKYAWLKYVSYMRDYRYIVREYYHNQPFLYQNPSYMDLFDQIFSNYLSFYMSKREGQRLYSDIAFAKSPYHIKQTFSNNMVLLNDTLQELVLLKGLKDAFSRKDFPVANLILTIDSLAISTRVPLYKQIAGNIKNEALKARAGFPAPQFELRDANGVFRQSSEFLANYVYLNFMSLESFTCQQDLELLKGLYEKHKGDFRIVTICIDDDFSKAIELFKAKGYEWMLLSYRTQKTIISDYKVRSYPSYYLINPEGQLALSPALTPGENFELQFFRIIQAQKSKSKY